MAQFQEPVDPIDPNDESGTTIEVPLYPKASWRLEKYASPEPTDYPYEIRQQDTMDINFSESASAPHSYRWRGLFPFLTVISGVSDYYFNIKTAGGFRVYVKPAIDIDSSTEFVKIIDRWSNAEEVTVSELVSVPSQWCAVIVEWHYITGRPSLEFSWSSTAITDDDDAGTPRDPNIELVEPFRIPLGWSLAEVVEDTFETNVGDATYEYLVGLPTTDTKQFYVRNLTKEHALDVAVLYPEFLTVDGQTTGIRRFYLDPRQERVLTMGVDLDDAKNLVLNRKLNYSSEMKVLVKVRNVYSVVFVKPW